MVQQQYLADFSLALVNRTGAYFISREIVDSLPEYFANIRYWRQFRQIPPTPGVQQKILGRVMMAELAKLRGSAAFQWPVPARYHDLPILFFDPLYALRSRLKREDIILCHDVGPLTHSELFESSTVGLYRDAYDKIQAVGPGIVFVSEASKNAFVKLFGNNFRFLKTIRLFTRQTAVDGPQKQPDNISQPFTLSVGALETRKNYERIIDAFAASGIAKNGMTHVICGPRGHGHESIAAKANSVEGIRLLGRVSDEELRWLYSNATGFVLPSLLEGFGVPAIEASHKGLVSVVSATSAQEEAIGGHGICVDPYDTADIAAGFKSLVTMPVGERQKTSEEAAQFARSWTVDNYREAWRGLLRNNGASI